MATLYDASKTGRKVVLGFLVLSAVVLAFETISNLQKDAILKPTDTSRYYMNAERKFGDIEKPKIPGISLDSSTQASYGIESVFTLLPDAAYVYKIEKPREKLGAFESAQNTVSVLGFNPLIYSTDNNKFTWVTAGSTKEISYNKETLTWSMRTKYADNIEAKRSKTLNSSIDTYSRAAVNLVGDLGFSSTGISAALVDARYAKYTNGTFFSNDDPLQADYVIANIYRNLPFADLKPQDQLPKTDNKALIPKAVSAYVYTEDPRVGEIRIIGSNKMSDYTKDIFELDYINYEYSVDPAAANLPLKSSYLIITPEEAWTKISSGQGSLVSVIPQGGNYFAEMPDSIAIRKFVADRSKTELGFYEPKEWTGYIYPIYVFKGRAELSDGRQANFVYYMEAIKRVD